MLYCVFVFYTLHLYFVAIAEEVAKLSDGSTPLASEVLSIVFVF